MYNQNNSVDNKDDIKLLCLMLIAIAFVIWLILPPRNKFIQINMLKASYNHNQVVKKQGSDPNAYLFHRNNAIYYMNINEKEKAVEEINKSLDLLPENVNNYMYNNLLRDRATFWIYNKEYKLALDDLLLIEEPDVLDIFRMALLYDELQDFEEMLNLCEIIVDRAPTSYEPLACLAKVYYNYGEYENAIKVYDVLIDRSKEMAVYWADRAYYKDLIGDSEGAKADYARAKELSNNVKTGLTVIENVIHPQKLDLEVIKY